MSLHLISHLLCPYVQRVVISLVEKNVDFKHTHIDLRNKPSWFLDISPLGKTPVLIHNKASIFESSVILEYLEETQPNPLHLSTALGRAHNRGWIEFGSSVLGDISGFYNTKDANIFAEKVQSITNKFELLEDELSDGPYFNGKKFSLVDAAFGPVFRYFDVFDKIRDFGIMNNTPKVNAWRKMLAQRPSIIGAVSPDYNELLGEFLQSRQSYFAMQL